MINIIFFHNDYLKVREIEEQDNVILAKWLSNPAVLEFYEGRDNSFDLDKVNTVFYTPEDDSVKCIVEYNDKKIGYIQFYQLDNESKEEYGYLNENVYGIDQFIGEVEYWNKGIGTLLVTNMMNFLIECKKAERIVMDPQIRNTRAIRCYEKCGFKKVKILVNHELHEGKYRDCWLMEYRK